MRQPKDTIITEMSSVFKRWTEIVAVALVGSGALKNKEVSNLDFLIITKKKFNKKEIINFYRKLSRFMQESLIRYFQDGFTFKSRGMSVNLTFFSKKEFEQKMTDIINGKKVELVYKDWVVGVFAPEGFCGDIQEAVVLLDCHLVNKWKLRLSKYPLKMKKAILKNSVQEIAIKESLLKEAVKRNNYISFYIVFSQILFIIIRILFALNEKYLQGVSYLKERTSDFSIDSKKLISLIVRISKIPEKRLKAKTLQMGVLIEKTKKLLKSKTHADL